MKIIRVVKVILQTKAEIVRYHLLWAKVLQGEPMHAMLLVVSMILRVCLYGPQILMSKRKIHSNIFKDSSVYAHRHSDNLTGRFVHHGLPSTILKHDLFLLETNWTMRPCDGRCVDDDSCCFDAVANKYRACTGPVCSLPSSAAKGPAS
jgi:hypothetical protein